MGVELLGPLPGEFRYDIRFSAAASTTARNAEAAKALISFLAGSKPRRPLKPKVSNLAEQSK